ncbi:MAG TPA: mechanosensitive ion channel family protein, partial [Bacillota bacterium]
GFGAQSLVRDVLAGFFILFEDQFQVGDHVELAGVEGFVEEIGFRVTKVRAWDGSIHIIPNGEITRVRNAARAPMRIMFEVRIAYDEDTERALQVLQDACDKFSGDPRVTSGPTVLGVSSLDESWLTVLIWGYARPGEQWAVGRELRLAVKKALDAAGIRVPYPRTVFMPAGTAAGPDRDGNQVSGG